MPALKVLFRTGGIWIHHENTSAMSVCSCQKTLYSPPVYVLEAASVKSQETANWKKKKRVRAEAHHSDEAVNCSPLLFVCYVLLLTPFVWAGGQCSLYLSRFFFDNVNHSPMFYPFFPFASFSSTSLGLVLPSSSLVCLRLCFDSY